MSTGGAEIVAAMEMTADSAAAAATGNLGGGGGLFLTLLGLRTGAKTRAADHPSSDANDSIRCQGKHAFKRRYTG